MRKIIGTLAVMTLVLTSCAKWFEGDLSDQSVVLLSPINNYEDSIQTKTFYWEELDDALEYELQVVSPSFDSLISFELDTVITDNNFTSSFTSGSYQWRVKAKNSASETAYSSRYFGISAAASLAGQVIILDAPSNQLATKDSVIEFSWTSIEGAEEYLFRIIDNSDGTEVLSTTISENSTTHTFEKDGNYRWTVQAINDNSASNTTEGYFTVDRVAPLSPVLSLPSDLDTISRFNIDFSWVQNATIGSSVFDSLFISTDSLFNTGDSFYSNSQSYRVDSLDANTYYWRVRSFDSAGNNGSYSDFKTVTVE